MYTGDVRTGVESMRRAFETDSLMPYFVVRVEYNNGIGWPWCRR